jgi:hypothetical protein
MFTVNNISIRIIFVIVRFERTGIHSVKFPNILRNQTVTIQTAHISLEAVSVTLGYTC